MGFANANENLRNMIKKMICNAVLFYSLIAQTANAQISSDEKSVHKHNVAITPFLGFPNLLTAAIKNTYELTNQRKEQLTIQGIGPIGIRAELKIIIGRPTNLMLSNYKMYRIQYS